MRSAAAPALRRDSLLRCIDFHSPSLGVRAGSTQSQIGEARRGEGNGVSSGSLRARRRRKHGPTRTGCSEAVQPVRRESGGHRSSHGPAPIPWAGRASQGSTDRMPFACLVVAHALNCRQHCHLSGSQRRATAPGVLKGLAHRNNPDCQTATCRLHTSSVWILQAKLAISADETQQLQNASAIHQSERA
jgi:hypothetical protein